MLIHHSRALLQPAQCNRDACRKTLHQPTKLSRSPMTGSMTIASVSDGLQCETLHFAPPRRESRCREDCRRRHTLPGHTKGAHNNRARPTEQITIADGRRVRKTRNARRRPRWSSITRRILIARIEEIPAVPKRPITGGLAPRLQDTWVETFHNSRRTQSKTAAARPRRAFK